MKIANRIFGLVFLIVCTAQAQDWASRNRFKENNAMIGQPHKNENRVVFMGNSITEMWGEIQPEFFAGKPYINRGISGQTTPQMLVRFRQDVIGLQPKVVIILAGTNDIAGNTGPSTLEMIEDNIASMAELAVAHHISVILCSVLPAFDYSWAPGKNPVKKIPELNDWIRKYAAEKGHTYVDFYFPLLDERGGLNSKYSEDGVHPNRPGYEVMAPLIEDAIEGCLKK